MPETPSRPSAGARKLAAKVPPMIRNNQAFDVESLAVLIDAALAEFVKAARNILTEDEPYPLQALEKVLAPWEPESGGGEAAWNAGRADAIEECAKAQWISVDERKPKERENGYRWVEVWDEYWQTCYYADWDGEAWEPCSDRDPGQNITHWRPLPKRPRSLSRKQEEPR